MLVGEIECHPVMLVEALRTALTEPQIEIFNSPIECLQYHPIAATVPIVAQLAVTTTGLGHRIYDNQPLN